MIWLLRHGEAAEGRPDAERPLTPKGEEQARNAGRALRAIGVKLTACFTSPKVRALYTAKLASEPLGAEPILEPKLAGGPFDPEQLAAGFEGQGDVLLVGHDPDFSMAVHDMTGAQVRMKKGGLAAVEKGELKVLLRPTETAAMAAAVDED